MRLNYYQAGNLHKLSLQTFRGFDISREISGKIRQIKGGADCEYKESTRKCIG